MLDFTNQTVLITGATGNLGIAVARKFQAAGARLSLVERGVDTLQKLYPDLIESREALLVSEIDLTQGSAMERAVQTTLERFGRIDVLVNTVGGFRGGTPVHETSEETWENLFNLNARPAFIASRAVIPHMLKNGSGKIVHVSARSAVQGISNSGVYSASKSVVVRLTESMAAEMRNSGINVNCILPGTIDTPQNRRERPNADFSRWVQPEEVADVALFLASNLARAVHGAAIPVYER